MKKTAILLLAMMLLASAAHSEALLVILFGDQLSTERFQMGINATVTGSSVRGPGDSKTYNSWAFGMFGEIKVIPQFKIQPELTVKTPAGARERTDFVLPEEIGDCIAEETITMDTRMNYLTMPIYFKYYPIPAFNLAAGPQFGYLTGAEDIYEGKTTEDHDLSVVRGMTGGYNRWDYGIVGKVEYVVSPHKEMRSPRISFNYYYGLSDIVKDNTGDEVYNSYWLLTLSIPMGGKDAAAEEAAD